MEIVLQQYNIYKTELSNNYFKYDFPYDNKIFNELIIFIQNNIELFYFLMNKEQLIIWNSRGKISLIDKYKQILSILVYDNDNYYSPKIKNTYTNSNIIKPFSIVKYIDKNNLPVFF